MENKDEVRKDLKLYLAADWDIKEETPEYYLLKKNTTSFSGHLLVFIFTFWFTFGLGNVVYHYLSNKTKKVLK